MQVVKKNNKKKNRETQLEANRASWSLLDFIFYFRLFIPS